MRIIGKLHDYYDSALSLGRDETLCFVRENTHAPTDVAHEFRVWLNRTLIDAGAAKEPRGRYFFEDDVKFSSYAISARYTFRPYDYGADMVVVGFCGVLYPGIRFRDVVYYLDNFEALDDVLAKAMEADPENINYYPSERTIDRLKRFVKTLTGLEHSKTFVEQKVPYFIYRNGRHDSAWEYVLDLCPVLKDYTFQRVKDPYTAFQEISMYLGGVIPRQAPDLVEISDKDRIAQHGFNKLSFRHPIKIKKEKHK